VIDGSRRGNSARFLNHACLTNCEVVETGDRVFIHALTAIKPGEELFIDYGLVIDGDLVPTINARRQCDDTMTRALPDSFHSRTIFHCPHTNL
jgi:SET domain-containing protein